MNKQLLEAIQQKVKLSQELEAWQDDMQTVINQQLKAQQLKEQRGTRTSSRLTIRKDYLMAPLSFLRRPSSHHPGGNAFLSMFKT
nr:PREDICTED: bicaudal D-related protein 2-like [Latimeria chalumnae]|eukprot:XP_014341753.1 PREDICTED: bicaudal D-related protein 2-like [Latimeria chalumnae]